MSKSPPAIDHANDQIKKKFAYDKKNFEYLWGIDADTVNQHGDQGVQLLNEDGTKKGEKWNQYYTSVENLDLKKQADAESKAYSDETAKQQWQMGKSQQQYEWDQQDAAYLKSNDTADDVLKFNQAEYEDAIKREETVLNEQFIESAFQNQNLIADLYEATGTKGFDAAATKLGLQQQESTLNSQKQKQLLNLEQSNKAAEFAETGAKLNMLDKAGSAEFQKAGVKQDLFIKEADNRFKKAALLMDMDSQDRIAQQQNDLIRRENKATYAKAAHESTEANLQSLKAQGDASLTAAGRSQGKAVQMVFAELGRQQAYIAKSLIHGTKAAEASMKNNLANAATTKQKSKLNLQQIADETGQNIDKALLNLQEIDRNLKISNAKGAISIDEIKKQVYDNIQNTTLDVETLENNLKHAQTETGLNLKKIDWDLQNLGSNFKTDQDILKASLDSAVDASALSVSDIIRSKQQADLEAEARRMLDPSIGREELDLDLFKPIEQPSPKYMDPQEPTLPPAPVMGAMMNDVSTGVGFTGAAIGGVTAGLGAAGAAASIATAGGSAAWATGLTAAIPGIGIGVAALTFLNMI